MRAREYFYAKLNPGGVVGCWLHPFQHSPNVCLGVTAKVGDTGDVCHHKTFQQNVSLGFKKNVEFAQG